MCQYIISLLFINRGTYLTFRRILLFINEQCMCEIEQAISPKLSISTIEFNITKFLENLNHYT